MTTTTTLDLQRREADSSIVFCGRLTDEQRKARIRAILSRSPGRRPVWIGDDGRLRLGHSGDLTQMLQDLNIPTSS